MINIKVIKSGEYCRYIITSGNGSYHNCNRNRLQKMFSWDRCDYKDVGNEKNLDKVMSYLVKEKQSIELLKRR